MKNSKVNFIASIYDKNIDDIDAIAKQLTTLGCQIDNVLPFSGIITGSTNTNHSLRELKIEGIKHIEAEKKLKIY